MSSKNKIDPGDIAIDPENLEKELVSIDHVLPRQLYIIPIRYRPIFPGIITPLIISKGRFADAIDQVLNNTRAIGLVLLKDDEVDDISSRNIHKIGTGAKILKKIKLPDGGVNVLINSLKRFEITEIIQEKPYIIANVEYLDDKQPPASKQNELKALTRSVLSQLKMLSENNPLFTEEMKLTMVNVDEPGKIADFVSSILNLEKEEYQKILETIDILNRLHLVLQMLQKELEVIDIQKKIQNQINDKIDKQQREFFLREQLKVIKQELGIDSDDRSRELGEMEEKIAELDVVDEVRNKLSEELDKLRMMEPNSSEYTVTRNYLDTLLSLPWNDQSDDDIDIRKASRILNKDHFGLDDVKERILEFLAVKKLKPDASGSIICLVGPPGVGKTSLGRSIARSLNREFFRMSLGGMRDEAEIKGHRRTYVGAMPGKIMQGIKITRTNNPVFMLDEIDKLGQSYQGDPASALLEVLDPEQNSSFRDHYLDVPFDLSNVFFITTANTLDSIPRVLLDRMEVIRLSGYISEEKYEIAKRYLLPKQVDKHGLDKNDLKLSKQGFLFVIQSYAREAGVRNLERNIEKLCRKSAAQKAKDEKLPEQPLSEEQIKAYLGPERYTDEEKFTIDRPGLVNGLAWTNMGGAILVIEALGIRQLKGHGLKITGQLGDVMSESANIAYSYVRQIVSDNDEYARFFNEHLIHLHVPAGATPKDGPSAGITMATALFSLVTNTTAKSSFAMTGELTLTGKVFPIGGLKEKLIAAKRAKIKNILYPHLNERDLQEVPDHVRKGLKFYPVSEFTEVLDIIFPKRKI